MLRPDTGKGGPRKPMAQVWVWAEQWGPPACKRGRANRVWRSSSKGRTGRSQRGGLGPVGRMVKGSECSFRSSDDFKN